MTNDIQIKEVGGRNVLTTRKWFIAAGGTTVYAGEPVKQFAAGSPYIEPVIDGEPVIGTIDAPIVGITKSAGTQTASADGYVEVYMIDENTVLSAKAKSAAAVDTQAEIDALVGKNVVLDLTTGSYTVDTAAANSNANGVTIVGGDVNSGRVYFRLRSSVLQGPTS